MNQKKLSKCCNYPTYEESGDCGMCGQKEEINEKRVYVINLSEVAMDFDFNELERNGEYERIMRMGELLGSVYSLEGFQNAINNEELDLSNSFILIK